MTDREKVIKGLQCCCSPTTYDCTNRCPYTSLYEPGNGYKNCMAALLPDALELLKEQEIGYREKSDALLKMWMDNDITDGEYGKIMNRLNKKTLNKKVKNDG